MTHSDHLSDLQAFVLVPLQELGLLISQNKHKNTRVQTMGFANAQTRIHVCPTGTTVAPGLQGTRKRTQLKRWITRLQVGQRQGRLLQLSLGVTNTNVAERILTKSYPTSQTEPKETKSY